MSSKEQKPPTAPPATLPGMKASVGREIGLRRNVYRRKVAAGTMAQSDANHEIAAMEAVYGVLNRLYVNEPANVELIARAMCGGEAASSVDFDGDIRPWVDQCWRDYENAAVTAMGIIAIGDLDGLLRGLQDVQRDRINLREAMRGIGMLPPKEAGDA